MVRGQVWTVVQGRYDMGGVVMRVVRKVMKKEEVEEDIVQVADGIEVRE